MAVVFSIPSFASAGATCFTNKAEYYAVKAKLPAAFQAVPVAFSGLPANTVAMKAQFNKSGKLVINYTYSVTVKVVGVPVTKTVEDTPMQAGKICVSGTSVTMGDYKGSISGNSLKVQTAAGPMTLTKKAPEAYAAVAQIVSGSK